MHYVPVVIIGAGQAGLAMSHCLTQHRIEHVVLERGRIAERWRSERWDSLRLLTPNWMTRLPGWSYHGDDPDGYMTAPEFVRYLADYARIIGRADQGRHHGAVGAVHAVWLPRRDQLVRLGNPRRRHRHGPVRRTQNSRFRAAPARMAASDDLVAVPQSRSAAGRRRAGSRRIRNRRAACGGDPTIRPACRASRPGRHTRLPRRYRGRDTWWWLERIGVLDEATDEVSDLHRARALPSFQLVGRAGRSHHRSRHIARCGRAHSWSRHRRRGQHLCTCATTWPRPPTRHRQRWNACWRASTSSLTRLALPPVRTMPPAPCMFDASPTALDLAAEGIRTVLWATGYRRDYSWLKVPVLDAAGEICHDGGITAVARTLCPRPEFPAPPTVALHRRRRLRCSGAGAGHRSAIWRSRTAPSA